MDVEAGKTYEVEYPFIRTTVSLFDSDLIRTVIAECGHQVGWFDPGSKRFCYTDEKEYRPDRHKSYTTPVYAIPLPREQKP